MRLCRIFTFLPLHILEEWIHTDGMNGIFEWAPSSCSTAEMFLFILWNGVLFVENRLHFDMCRNFTFYLFAEKNFLSDLVRHLSFICPRIVIITLLMSMDAIQKGINCFSIFSIRIFASYFVLRKTNVKRYYHIEMEIHISICSRKKIRHEHVNSYFCMEHELSWVNGLINIISIGMKEMNGKRAPQI